MGRILRGIAWRASEAGSFRHRAPRRDRPRFSLEQDSWNGERYLQLSVADFKSSRALIPSFRLQPPTATMYADVLAEACANRRRRHRSSRHVAVYITMGSAGGPSCRPIRRQDKCRVDSGLSEHFAPSHLKRLRDQDYNYAI
jgi:hypothetical protein